MLESTPTISLILLTFLFLLLTPLLHYTFHHVTTMPPPSSLISRLKVQLKLSISRLRMTQKKDTELAKVARREMAQLMEAQKLESARIRVENIIRSDITTELHEILELYCELLLARIQLLEPPATPSALAASRTEHGAPDVDPGLEEAVRSIMYAAARTDIKELHQARNLLIEKFGKEFAVATMEGEGVAARVLAKLKVETPPRALVDAYLREIARTYAVRFPGDPIELSDDGEDDDDDDEPSGGVKVKALEAPLEAEELSRATPPRDVGGRDPPIHIAPASPSSENPNSTIKMPAGEKPVARRKSSSTGGDKAKGSADKASKKEKKDGDGGGPGGKIPDVDELARRFAALKR